MAQTQVCTCSWCSSVVSSMTVYLDPCNSSTSCCISSLILQISFSHRCYVVARRPTWWTTEFRSERPHVWRYKFWGLTLNMSCIKLGGIFNSHVLQGGVVMHLMWAENMHEMCDRLAKIGDQFRTSSEPASVMVFGFKQRKILLVSRRPNFTKFEHSTSIGDAMNPFGTELWQFPCDGSFFNKISKIWISFSTSCDFRPP